MVAISEDTLRAARISEAEFRQEAAILLYEKGLSLMKAAEVAQLDRFAFQHLLASRDIPVHYDAEDFDADLDALESL
jgi:predicted HTH domain antitoxin